MERLIRTKVGYRLAQAGALLMILGGLGDQFIRDLLPVHESFLGYEAGESPKAVASLVLALLHALGSNLIASGLATLVLLHEMRRSGKQLLAGAIVIVVLLSEGMNAWQMYQIGSPFYLGPLAFAAFVLLGLALCSFPKWSFGPSTEEQA